MKVVHRCGKCGSTNHKMEITIEPSDREEFLKFTDTIYNAASPERLAQFHIPPSKYAPKFPLVIPAPGQNPCDHCKYGAEAIGPSGCGRGENCLPLAYYRINQIKTSTAISPETSLKEFVCDAQPATWLQPKKKDRVRSAVLPLSLTQKTSSETVRLKSSRKSVRRKSKRQK